ncbi:hypothetical protein SAMN02910456_01699 [Ruminococcaceae bacterium YRB3002]|nr:hypothetical protein SAMN02910456_01699 [Ruminococcaceae bacterium YRB3002]
MESDIVRVSKIRLGHLNELIRRLESRIDSAPEGRVKVNTSTGKTKYLLVDPGNPNGRYLRTEELPTAQKLAQKSYDTRVLKAAICEQMFLQQLINSYPEELPEDVFFKLTQERQKLITPVYKPDDVFAREWESVPFEPKPFEPGDPEIYTNRGERVRSKSEKIIADRLYERGVPYKYECPKKLKKIGEIHPDFTVLNMRKRREEYIEHNGRMDDIKYVNSFIIRCNAYELTGIKAGDRLHLLFETDKVPINTKVLDRLIDTLIP